MDYLRPPIPSDLVCAHAIVRDCLGTLVMTSCAPTVFAARYVIIVMSALYACCPYPFGERCRALVMLYPEGDLYRGVLHCPHPLLIVPPRFAAASLCLLVCYASE